jgi:hypothetical protein
MLIIRVTKEGGWYVTRDGKHLTATQTAEAIAKGEPQKIVREK